MRVNTEMKKAYLFVLLLFIWLFGYAMQTMEPKPLGLTVVVQNGEYQEEISCWQSEKDGYFVFLPSYATLNDITLCVRDNSDIRLDGEKLCLKTKCDNLKIEVSYSLSYVDKGKRVESTIQFKKSNDVPAMFIETESGTMDHVNAKRTNKEGGSVKVYSTDGRMKQEKLKSLEGRGNSTWDYLEKKPYNIKLQQEADLLGMGKADKWVLLANGYDPTNMRNKIVYDFANEIDMAFSPQSQWVDLYLNGEYAGLYLLSERNEIHQERVDIQTEGSCLVSVEMENRLLEFGYPHVMTEAAQPLRIHSRNEVAEAEKNQIANVFQTMENAILAEDGVDAESGQHWSELIDMDSWVKAYLIEEIFANYDGFFSSQFFYYDAAVGKVFAGPVWDFDLSMRDSFLNCEEHDDVAAYRVYVQDQTQRPWFVNLCRSETFMSRVKEVYSEQVAPALERLLSNGIKDYAAMISQAGYMNEIRWPGDESFDEDVQKVLAYLQKRVCFLEKLWFGNQTYHTVEVNLVTKHYAYFPVVDGSCLSCLPMPEGSGNQVFVGWYYTNTDEPFDISKPITEDTAIYAKWTGLSTVWWTRVGKLLPAGVIAMMFLVLVLADVRRMRKGG